MRRLLAIASAIALLAALAAAPARADFGLHDLDVRFSDADGEAAMQAGSHPFSFTNEFEVNVVIDPVLGEVPDGQPRDLTVELPVGLVGSPSAVPRCSAADFLSDNVVIPGSVGGTLPDCPYGSAVGLVTLRGALGDAKALTATGPVFNLVPPPGVAARLGFLPVVGPRVTVDVGLEEAPPHKLIARVLNITQIPRFYRSSLTLWGNPASPAHDDDRAACGAFGEGSDFGDILGISCPANVAERPFLTMPRACSGQPLLTRFEMLSWQGERFVETVATDDGGEPPAPLAVHGCERLGFAPEISAQPTSRSAESASGLDFALRIEDEGLLDPEGLAQSDIKRAEVTLPEGVTINPSQAEGLGTCSPGQLARETASSAFGAGCPGSSKIGTVEVETPLLEDTTFKGTLFVATPHDNPFDSLLALYMTIKEPRLGIGLKLAGKVEPHPDTGQLLTTFDDLPQLPFSHFRLRFREGARSPLVTPNRCGRFETKAVFTPWANPSTTHTATSSFEVSSGVGGGPCPAGGAPPFEPGLAAGTINNAAGAYSPFFLRLTRRDGDADLTRFDATLPPGMVARLAGVSRCPDAQIALAQAKSGAAELRSPSCPLGSRIGRVQAGAGVGSQLTYVPGTVYLAGPFAGAPLSVVAVVPAVAGPFDVGTVVTRQALVVDPVTAQVEVDGSRSEPIPHILAGIPLRVRDIQVHVDRSGFTLNPTSCEPMAVGASIWGGGANVFSTLDDSPVARSARFQAAGCARLGFKPRLGLRLRGGTRRGANPALLAVLRANPGDANIKRTIVRLPRSAFLDQSHIRTICTRVQFAADRCPRGAIYGRVVAHSPLLDEPLRGPAYLRSSNNQLPDLVFDLKGLIDIEAAARIDSIRGGIRAIFPAIPDAPLSRVVVRMAGGKRGLIVNSRHLCRGKNRANVRLDAQSGIRRKLRPLVRPTACNKQRRAAKRSRAAHRRR